MYVICNVGYEGIEDLLYASTDPEEINTKLKEFKQRAIIQQERETKIHELYIKYNSLSLYNDDDDVIYEEEDKIRNSYPRDEVYWNGPDRICVQYWNGEKFECVCPKFEDSPDRVVLY